MGRQRVLIFIESETDLALVRLDPLVHGLHVTGEAVGRGKHLSALSALDVLLRILIAAAWRQGRV